MLFIRYYLRKRALSFVCQILFSKSRHDSIHSRNTSSAARHYLMSGSSGHVVVNSQQCAVNPVSSDLRRTQATLGACIIQAGLIAVCFSPTPSTIHHPPYIAFFPPLLFTCGVLDLHFLRIIQSDTTGKLYRLQQRSLVLLPLGVFPSLGLPKEKRHESLE